MLWYASQISLTAGLISLDGTAALQVMLSEPLPACAVIGLVFGYPAAGIIIGISFQLLFTSDLPVGSHLPKDSSLLAMSALGAALVSGCDRGAGNPDILAAAALLAVIAEPATAVTGVMVRRANARLTPVVQGLLEQGRYRRALVAAQGGLALFFLRGFLTVLLFSLGGGWLLSWAARLLPPGLLGAAHWSFAVFPLVGAGHFLSGLGGEDLRRFSPRFFHEHARRMG